MSLARFSLSSSTFSSLLHTGLCALAFLMPMRLSWAAGDAVAGRASFAKCASCHQIGPSARGGFGPQLHNVIGRKAGSTTDYKYSDAMKKSNIVWTEDKLRAFLKAPSDVVPGNKMRFWGIGSDTQIDNILAYLRQSG